MEYRWPRAIHGNTNKIWFGGDYNPEQWPEEVWKDDIRLMKKANVNIVTLGVFAWALIEPEENVYDFSWLDRIVGMLYENGISVDMATATATPPRWLTQAHPEILPKDEKGCVIWPGGRQHFRPTSPVFRKYALNLTRKMAGHFKGNPAIVSWHVSNEFGCHNVFDYSDDAAAAFRSYLKDKYGTLERLNEAWNGAFWSQKVTDWDQIIPPRQCYAGSNPTEMVDFKRFSSEALLSLYKAEAGILHEITPDIPVTTNLMVIENHTDPVDCFKWGPALDFVSNDHYYLPDDRHLDEMLMSAAIVSGIAQKKPWFLMENSTSSVNWRPVNVRKQPGEIIRDALAHMANGADDVCFFQWRQSQAGAEKFHSSMVPHAGENTKIFREVCKLGEILHDLSEVQGSQVKKSPIALVYDYDSWWAYENGLLTKNFNYRAEFYHWFRACLDAGIYPDIVGKHDHWEDWETVMFPATVMIDRKTEARAEKYAAEGGNLIVTYGSGIVDEDDHAYLGGYPGPFRRVCGIRVEEFCAVSENDKVPIKVEGKIPCAAHHWNGVLWADDLSCASDSCQVIASIEDTAADRGLRLQPIITKNRYGKGTASYIGVKLVRSDALQMIRILLESDDVTNEQKYLTEIVRENSDKEYHFLFNRSSDKDITVPVHGKVLCCVNGEEKEDVLTLNSSGAAVIRRQK